MSIEILALKCPCCGNTFMIDPLLDRQIVHCEYCDTNLLISNNDVYKKINNDLEYCYSFNIDVNEHDPKDIINYFLKNYDGDDCTISIECKMNPNRRKKHKIADKYEKEQALEKQKQDFDEFHRKDKNSLMILMILLFEIFCSILVAIYSFNTKSWGNLWYGIPGTLVSAYGALLAGSVLDSNAKSMQPDEAAVVWSYISTIITGMLLILFVRNAIN